MATGEPYIYPVDGYKLTQGFGDDPDYYAQYGQKGHNGLDLGVSLDTPVMASRDGVIKYAGDGSGLYYVGSIAGNYVLIDHGDMWTGYAHNNSLNVKAGQRVSQGDVIAYAGKTGDASGVHVHFEFIPPANPVTNGNGYWGRVNPSKYLEGESMEMTRDQCKWSYYDIAGQWPTEEELANYVGKDYVWAEEEIKRFFANIHRCAWDYRVLSEAQAKEIEDLQKQLDSKFVPAGPLFVQK